ncbi:hypothetical protein H6F76_17010 [Leptolyngbya sp. FACHB-321]|uniref:hypothetical protein n=1 Tax=Leptolyngbya sp. FACHB-321 TaxID=2692807 RepID=UPI0016885EB8|nr:hypothetical protein [Leptolyngbya sp. FACHB-321]MBD2036712.1 hypothetical protein [Leptolyngbya sp. FACHB-321]
MTDNFPQTVQSVKNTLDGFTNETINVATVEAKSTLNKLLHVMGNSGQTLNNLASNLNQPVSGLNEATTKLNTSMLEATDGAVNIITETTHQAASAVKETAAQATGTLNGATNIVVHKLNNATSSITQTAEKTKLALDETLQKTEQLSGAISNSVQDVVATSVKMWMAQHPIVSWVMAHPVWTIALVLLLLFLCWGLLAAIAQFTQQVWLFILQAPLKLTQSLAKGTFQSLKRFEILQPAKSEGQGNVQQRLHEILNHLELLRQEQEVLMKEMHSILSSKS